jgi:hypothetical protein
VCGEWILKRVGHIGKYSLKFPKGESNLVNHTSKAILKNGYYEVNGLKFSKYYYNKLWSTRRGAPSLVAKEILKAGVKHTVPDALKPGFN